MLQLTVVVVVSWAVVVSWPEVQQPALVRKMMLESRLGRA